MSISHRYFKVRTIHINENSCFHTTAYNNHVIKLSDDLDLFAKASDGKSSGDSPVTVGKVLGSINHASRIFTDVEECVSIESIASNILEGPEINNVNTQNINDEVNIPNTSTMIMDLSSDELFGSTSSEITEASTTKVTSKRGRPSRAKGPKGAKKVRLAASIEEVAAEIQAIAVIATPQEKGESESEEGNELSPTVSAMVIVPTIISPPPADVTVVMSLPSAVDVTSNADIGVIETVIDNTVEEAVNSMESAKRKRRSCNTLLLSNGVKSTLKVSPTPESEVLSPEIALKIQCHQERLKVVLAELVVLET